MLVRAGTRLVRGVVGAVVAPSWLVQTERPGFESSRVSNAGRLARLSAVWIINLVAYAVPLTLAGIGFTATTDAPTAIAVVVTPLGISADGLWRLLVGTAQNSAFLTVATAVVFVTFHGSVLAVERSRGYLQSLYTVVYATSVYLVGIFTLVLFASTSAQVPTAEGFLRESQLVFIETTLTLFGLGLTAGTIDPEGLSLAGLSPRGELLLAGLLVFSVYFLYSMYLGARLNHGLDRLQSALVVGGVLFAPVLYVLGSALFTIALDGSVTLAVLAPGWVQ
ncbi:hypothetical protein [Halovenus halobia]|uniref:hypothetical protein n=1 Tax=Halovenus halobia TaxID=3396622 RepID=UPI003F57BFE8